MRIAKIEVENQGLVTTGLKVTIEIRWPWLISLLLHHHVRRTLKAKRHPQ